MDETPPIRSGDYLLSILGLAAARDLFKAPEQVPIRVQEMTHVVAHAGEFPFDFTVRFVEHDVVAGYTVWSASYDRPQTNPAIMIEEALTLPQLAAAPPGRALDVACGTGRQVERLQDLGYAVSGIDVTPAMVERARDRCPDADLRVGDWTALPYDDDTFDLVTCALALCHATDVDPPIREMARVARPGGWLVVSDMHPFSTIHGGAAAFPGDDLGHIPFVRNQVHQLSEYFAAFRGAGLAVRDLGEGLSQPEHVALLPSHAAFPEATQRAFVGTPTIVAWTAVKPSPASVDELA
jgi:ubiquinone/menaquinone biosynthesis C-methylase UbiE